MKNNFSYLFSQIIYFFSTITFILLPVVLLSCDPEGDIKKVDKSEIITITSTPPTTLSANGIDSYSIVVKLPAQTAEAYRLVTFRGSDGKFQGEGKDPKERQIRIDNNGNASVTWIVPEKEGDYYITASVGSPPTVYTTEQKVTVKDIAKSLTIELDSADLAKKRLTESTITADGKQVLKFNAKISPAVSTSLKTLTFRCSNGKFDEEGDAMSRTVKVNQNGEASINWIVPSQPGTSYISVSTGTGTDQEKKQKALTLLEAKPSFTLTKLPSSTTLADGLTILAYKITGAANIPSNKLIIAKNKGTLIDVAGSVMKDGTLKLVNGEAIFYLQLEQTVETYFIKVQTESGDNYQNDTFIPSRAYAESISILPSKLVIEKNDTDLDITVSLKRSLGKVSVGTPVSFTIYQIINGIRKDIGGLYKDLAKAFSDVNETVTVKYLLDRSKISTQFPLIIEVTSPKEAPQQLASNQIEVKFKPD